MLMKGAGGAGGRAASCLHTGWLLVPEQLWQGAGSRREAREREQAASPPACMGCVRGLGTRVLPTAARTACQARLLDTPFPLFSSHLPPSSIVLQLRIHRRYQDPSLSGSFSASPVLDPDPWVSATDPALAPRASAPVSPLGPTPFLFSPGDLLHESEYHPWSSLKDSPKISQHWREPKPKGNLTYHQYMPPGWRQGSRVDSQAKGLALGPPGPPLWEGTNSQQPPPRMKPTALTSSPPGVPSPSPPPHKLELQTLKLEELTVSELRQQLRLRGLPVSGTKSMLLERMRGGALPRERPKPRREDGPSGAPWPRLRPKALGAVRRQGSLKPSPNSHPPPRARASDTPATAAVPTPASAPAAAPAPTPSSALPTAALTVEEELQEAIRRAQVRGSGLGVSVRMVRDPRFTPLLPVRSCFRTGALMTSWRIRWSLRTRCPSSPWTSPAPSTCCPPPRTLKASPLSSLPRYRPPQTPRPPLPGAPQTPWTGWSL
ncbi:MEF2-activating motif and SAP domain-containing transcriptional regulator isoform X1 [Callorhinus ursinus]|uniref:MEF2-activating motif and SAP domain-containing transcriptional regulator isoform X1 n=1 Tax=Callorhinus ursinus TaxID=34884 RepID=UPI003CD04E3D